MNPLLSSTLLLESPNTEKNPSRKLRRKLLKMPELFLEYDFEKSVNSAKKHKIFLLFLFSLYLMLIFKNQKIIMN